MCNRLSSMKIAKRARVAWLAVSLLSSGAALHAEVDTTPGPADPATGIQPADDGIRGGGRTAPMSEENFVKAVAQTVLAESELSRIALDRTRNLRVNLLAERTLKDQEKINRSLKEAAGKQRVAVPERLDVDHQAMVSTLRLQPTEKFDATYIAQIRETRGKAKMLFAQAKNSDSLSGPLRQFASASLEVLESNEQQLLGLAAPEKSKGVDTAAY